jgi:hypothetical protein
VFPLHESGQRNRRAAFIATVIGVVALALAVPAPSLALIAPPVTIDGPGPEIVEFGGVAMAPDGTGGLVYVKTVGGVPHVFASRFDGSAWSTPIRVDTEEPYEASQPRIAAGDHGELMVIWVTQTATLVKGGRARTIEHGIYSARLGRGASEFGSSLLVDPAVGNGLGVDPSLAGVSAGKAIVAYRVVTNDFSPENRTAQNERQVPLRPGDVMAEIKLARLTGERWSRLGAINRNLASSVRSPTAANAPQVGIGDDGGAVVAWQEPDQTGVARIWMRRIYGSTVGPILAASPTTWAGSPVSGDIDSFSLAVTPFDGAYVAMRTAPEAGGSHLFVNSLPPTATSAGKALIGSELVATQPAFGRPGISASEGGGGEKERAVRLGVVAGAEVDQFGAPSGVKLQPVADAGSPAAVADAEAVATVDFEGNGVLAYPTEGPEGVQLAVRQEFASGAVQVGAVAGTGGGPIGELAIGPSGAGDALIGFRQGEPGALEIAVERVSAPPARFPVEAPPRWVRPQDAVLRWKPAPSATGGTTYSVLLDGRMAKEGLDAFSYTPNVAQVESGVTEAQVLATDSLGQRLLSQPVKLRVDAVPPKVTVSVRPSKRRLEIRLKDIDSGVMAGATRVTFGDGRQRKGGARLVHVYKSAGTYPVIVKARDRAGNRETRRFEVKVR